MKNVLRQWIVGIRIEVGPFEHGRDLAAVIVQDCTGDNPLSLFGVVLRVSAAREVPVRLTEETPAIADFGHKDVKDIGDFLRLDDDEAF